MAKEKESKFIGDTGMVRIIGFAKDIEVIHEEPKPKRLKDKLQQ